MKKKFLILLLTTILLLSLAGCGSSSKLSSMTNEAGMKSAAGIGWNGSMDGAVSNSASLSGSGSSVSSNIYAEDFIEIAPEMPIPDEPYGGGEVLANSKIIYTANLSLETQEFEASVNSLSDLVREMGGYFENKNTMNGDSYRSLDCTIRVPVENFSSFLDKVGETAHVTKRSEDLDDISETYYDQEARLTTQRTKLDRLHALLSEAENMEDIITLESAISDTELQIEYLTGSLRKYDSLVDFSTINIYLQEVYRLSDDDSIPESFGERFSAAIALGFRRGVEGIEDFAIGVAQNWLTILLFVCFVLIFVTIILRRRAKRGTSRRRFSLEKKLKTPTNSENNPHK